MPRTVERSDRRPSLRRVRREFRPFRRDAFEALAGIIVAVVCQVVSPLVVAYAIDRGVVDRDTAIVAACTLAMVFLVAGQVGGSYFEQRAMGRFAQRYLADLRRRLLDHLHALDLDYFSREQAGRVVARLTSDVESLQQFLQSGLSLLVRGILLVTLATIVMLTQSWQLTLAVLAILPVLALASRWYRPRAFDIQLGFRESMANLLNHVNEALVGMRVVQAYGIESQQRGTFANINDATYNARMRSGRVTSIYYAIIEFLHPLALAIVVGYGSVLANRGVIEVGTLIVFTLYLTRLFEPIQQFTELNTLMQAASAAFTRTFEFLEHEPSLVDASDALPFRSDAGVVRLEHVTFRYAPDSPAAVRTSISSCERASASRWWAPAAPASRPWRSSSVASTTRPPGAWSSTVRTCERSRAARCASTWSWCPRKDSSSTGPSPTTSGSADRAQAATRSTPRVVSSASRPRSPGSRVGSMPRWRTVG